MNSALKHIILTKPKTKIYGVSWDKSDSSTPIRTDDALGFRANAGIDNVPALNDFDFADIYSEIRDVTDEFGNVFVRIPKFYIRKVDTENFKSWRVSKKKWNHEWYLPWCFWDFTNSKELPYFDIGKYNASLSAGNKLESLPNKYPLMNKTIIDFRNYAQANGSGYQQMDIHAVDIIRTLFFIEFATIDSQSIMQGWTGGQYTATHVATVAENTVNRIIIANSFANLYSVGQPVSIGTSQGGNQIAYNREITAIDVYDASNKAISFDGAAVNIAIGNMIYNSGWKSGFSSGIKAKSGSIGSNSTAKFPCVYRGIENPFGSMWQFVDGININEWQSWVCKSAAQYTSNVFASPYEQVGYINANTNNYVRETGYDASKPFIEIPTVVSSSYVKYKDYYYQSSGQRIALFGASWAYGSGAGLSYWALAYSSTSASLYIGGRLLKKPL